MAKKQYSIESSADGKKWVRRGGWQEGDKMRTGELINPDEMLLEAKAYRNHFKPEGDRKYVRVIIEL